MDKLLYGRLCLLSQGCERCGIGDGQLGEHLAVDVHAGDLQAVHHLGIGQAVQAGRRVDAGDPQATEVALLLLAADICITQGTANLCAGGTLLLALRAKVTLGELHYLTLFLLCVHRTLNSCHS